MSEISKKIAFYTATLICFFPLFNITFKSIAVILFCFSHLSTIFFEKKANLLPKSKSELTILLTPFILILLNSTLRIRNYDSLFFLEKSLGLAFIPFSLFISTKKYTRSEIEKLIYIYLVTIILFSLKGIYGIFIDTIPYVGQGKLITSLNDFIHYPNLTVHFRVAFENHCGLHPTYASMYIGIGLFALLSSLLLKTPILTISAKLKAALLLYFTFLLILLAARAPFIAVIAGTLFLFFISKTSVLVKISSSAIILLLIIIAVFTIPTISQRFKEVNIHTTSDNIVEHDSFNIRIELLNCTKNILKNNWLFGVSPGLIQQELNTCLVSKSRETFENKNYNTHNQYLDYWASMGILGISSLLAVLILGLIKIIASNKYYLMPILFLFIITMLTENILHRQDGVIMFSVFIGSLFFHKSEE